MNLLKKVIPVLFFGLIFLAVIYFIEPAPDITQLSFIKDLAFFLPLLAFLTFIVRLFTKPIFLSLILSLSMIFLLILKALDSLSFISASLTILGTFLILKSLKNQRQSSYTTKFPKLSQLKKQ